MLAPLPAPLAVDLGPDETLDSVLRGRVRLVQRRKGYRFAVDPLLLAAFAGRARGPVADLGTGCGVLALLLAARGAGEVVAVEVQPALAELAERNVAINGAQARVRVLRADLRALRGLLPRGTFGLVVSNPPYVPLGAGNLSPAGEKALARHQLACTPDDLARAARFLLADGGALAVVYPAAQLTELLTAVVGAGLEPKRLRLVHPLPDRPARLALLEAVKGAGAVLEVLPPLFLFSSPGVVSPECERVVSDPEDEGLGGEAGGG